MLRAYKILSFIPLSFKFKKTNSLICENQTHARMTWHKLAFYREDLWCPVIPQVDKAYADFWRATLVDEKGKRSTEIRLGDIIELHGLPFNSFVVLRLVDYLVEQLYIINNNNNTHTHTPTFVCLHSFIIYLLADNTSMYSTKKPRAWRSCA